MAKTCRLGLNQQQDDESKSEYSNNQETREVLSVEKYTLGRQVPTNNADRLPVISVEGLSRANVSLRCAGRLSDHPFSSASSDVRVCKERSCVAADG